jgi:excisionase family DNA binding protein
MTTSAPERELLRPSEVAERLDCSLASVYRAIHRGEL